MNSSLHPFLHSCTLFFSPSRPLRNPQLHVLQRRPHPLNQRSFYSPRRALVISTLIMHQSPKRNLARNASYSLRNLSFAGQPSSLPALPSISSFLGDAQDPISCEKNRILDIRTPFSYRFLDMGLCHNEDSLSFLRYPNSTIGRICRDSRFFASVAEAVSSTDVDEDTSSIEEIQEMLEDLSKIEVSEGSKICRNLKEVQPKPQLEKPRMACGIGSGKYAMLWRRQIKIETATWEQAVKEYKELLMDMLEQKLAQNLPYVKSLFLGWFEPLRDRIAAEQEQCRDPRGSVSCPIYNLISFRLT